MIIYCAPCSVPFTYPTPSTMSGAFSHYTSDMNPTSMVLWKFEWRERTITYPFSMVLIAVLMLLGLAGVGIRWWCRQRGS